MSSPHRASRHIVLDCRSIHRHMGGIGRAACELAIHMGARPRGHRITVMLGADPPRDLSIPGVELVEVEAAMIDEHFEQFGLPGVLEDMGADVYFNTTFSIPALKTTAYQLTIVHDVVFEDRPEWVEPRLREYLRRWSRFSVAHADRIITVSDHARARIRSVYDVEDSRVVRIYNGVSRSSFAHPADGDVSQTLSRHGLTTAYLLYLGTLEPKKGTPELLTAFGRLAKSGFDGHLVLGGAKGGPQYDLEAAIAGTGCPERVRVMGYVDEQDKKSLLAGCHLFVYPSRYEGFGLPPLEAMALGKPCLTSDATSIPEIVGDAALKVDVTDIDAFVGAMQRGIGDPQFRRRAREAGPKRAASFPWERSADQVLDLCESLEAA